MLKNANLNLVWTLFILGLSIIAAAIESFGSEVVQFWAMIVIAIVVIVFSLVMRAEEVRRNPEETEAEKPLPQLVTLVITIVWVLKMPELLGHVITVPFIRLPVYALLTVALMVALEKFFDRRKA